MIDSMSVRQQWGFTEYGPLDKVESLVESMEMSAESHAARYNQGALGTIALLMEALDEVGMNMLDLTDREIAELADYEGSIEIKHSINNSDEDEYGEE